jgi:hypothetical protein
MVLKIYSESLLYFDGILITTDKECLSTESASRLSFQANDKQLSKSQINQVRIIVTSYLRGFLTTCLTNLLLPSHVADFQAGNCPQKAIPRPLTGFLSDLHGR